MSEVQWDAHLVIRIIAILIIIAAIVTGVKLFEYQDRPLLEMKNVAAGSASIKIIHNGGGQISAVDVNLEVWVNGTPRNSMLIFISGDNDENFESGEAINVSLTMPLQTGDIVAVVYKPTNHLFLTEKVA